MSELVVFLNELSCDCPGLTLAQIRPCVIMAISAMRDASKLRNNATLRLHKPLGKITLGDESWTLAIILHGDKDLFTRLKGFLNIDPCGHLAQGSHDVTFNGNTTIGLSWADAEKSFVASFGYIKPWSDQSIDCHRKILLNNSEISDAPIQVRNLATTAHVNAWKDVIKRYGIEVAKTSLLLERGAFFVRMHFHDHWPPHIHVYPRRNDTYDCIARVRVDNYDVLEHTKEFDSSMRHDILEYISQNQAYLLETWKQVKSQ